MSWNSAEGNRWHVIATRREQGSPLLQVSRDGAVSKVQVRACLIRMWPGGTVQGAGKFTHYSIRNIDAGDFFLEP